MNSLPTNSMTELQQLINQYQVTLDEDLKAELIERDFTILIDLDKWDFLLTLIEKETTYDLVKVNIYKMIELESFNEQAILSIKNRILGAVKTEEDEMVKQYGFMALTWNFSHYTDVIDLCVQTVEDLQEDEDVRHCAFSVLTKSSEYKIIASLRERLLKVVGFEKYATTFFKERDTKELK